MHTSSNNLNKFKDASWMLPFFSCLSEESPPPYHEIQSNEATHFGIFSWEETTWYMGKINVFGYLSHERCEQLI